MKKILSLLLAVMMIMALATTAFADGPVAAAKTQAVKLYKIYTVDGERNAANGEAAETATLFPNEVLSFVVKGVSGPVDPIPAITAENMTIAGIETNTLTLNLPEYSKVGVYEYTISEKTTGITETQGVTYIGGTISFKVLVEWMDETDHSNGMKSTAYLTQTGSEEDETSHNQGTEEKPAYKKDTFTNEYDLGALSVQKLITGNLAEEDDEFVITVTLTSAEPVLSDISYYGKDNGTISYENGWTANETGTSYSWNKNLTLSATDKVTFVNIPAGVQWNIVEADYTTGGDNDDNYGYDAAVYSDGTQNVTEATPADPTGISGGVATTELDEVTVTNNKETTIATGVITDSAPYILLIAVCAVAAVLFVIKRRNTVDF